MAKALFGHLGGTAQLHDRELARLRRRVADLTEEVAQLAEENRLLAAEVDALTTGLPATMSEPVHLDLMSDDSGVSNTAGDGDSVSRPALA